MPIKVSADGLSIVTTNSEGTAMATIPDVCCIPTSSGKTPVPFPNIVESKNAKATSVMTEINGGKVCCQGSYCEPSTGDEGGILGGVSSGTIGGKATFMLYSPTVMVEGRPVCRKSDLMIMNDGNTVSLSGMNQEDVEPPEDILGVEEETQPFNMNLSFLDDNDEIDDEFIFKVRGEIVARGSVKNDGAISVELPVSCKEGTLLIGKNKSCRQSYTILLENFPQGEKGIQARLNNLGYAAGHVDGRVRASTKRAIEQLQNENSMPVTGQADGTVEGKLKSLETD